LSEPLVEINEENDTVSTAEPGLVKDPSKYVMVPANARIKHRDLEERIGKIARYAEDCPFNTVEMKDTGLGIITSGISYNYVKEAVPDASVLKLGLVFPLPTDLIMDFTSRCERIVVVEELEPYLEEWVRFLGIECEGKSLIPRFGEIDTGMVRKALSDTGEGYGPSRSDSIGTEEVPVRPPVMCVGCPHRGMFQILMRKKAFVAGDIGCYTLAVSPPLSAIHTTVCMGAGVSQAVGIEAVLPEEHGKVVAVIGDSTFLHSGMGSVLNMAYNEIPATVIILDNYTTAMTGRQDHPGSGFDADGNRTRQVDWETLLKGLGVEHVRLVDAYDLEGIRNVLEEEIHRDSPSVIVVQGACMLLRNRPVKIHDPYRIDRDVCTNCGMCLRVGCPAISRKDASPEESPIIDETQCTGCDLCFQVCEFEAIGREG
jgi:indolepyruvate ferredoxin oxidoreductase alpha subunit